MCLHNDVNVEHRCVGTITVHKTNTGYVAQLRDGLGDVKKHCPHFHKDIGDATMCGRSHYVKHQQGECFCVYFKNPIPPYLYKNPNTQFYIIKHDGWFVWKVGVSTHVDDKRLSEHYQNGWKLYAKWSGLAGVKSFEWEQKIIERWRETGFNPAVKHSDMPQGGASETVSYYNVDETAIGLIVEELIKVFKYKPTMGATNKMV